MPPSRTSSYERLQIRPDHVRYPIHLGTAPEFVHVERPTLHGIAQSFQGYIEPYLVPEFETISNELDYFYIPKLAEMDSEIICDAANEVWDLVIGLMPE